MTILEKGLNGPLRDNILARRLYAIATQPSGWADDDKVIQYRLSKETPRAEKESKTYSYPNRGVVDSRLTHLLVCNVKKFPKPCTLKAQYFGISFCKNERPVSTVILGDNGVGKTSLYASLEQVGLRKMNTAFIRGYKKIIGEAAESNQPESIFGEETQEEFLRHAITPIDKTSIIATTSGQALYWKGSEMHLNSLPLVHEAFYCSDYDVRMLETCSDLTKFFIDQLGFETYFRSLELLTRLSLRYHGFKSKELSGTMIENEGEMIEAKTPHEDLPLIDDKEIDDLIALISFLEISFAEMINLHREKMTNAILTLLESSFSESELRLVIEMDCHPVTRNATLQEVLRHPEEGANSPLFKFNIYLTPNLENHVSNLPHVAPRACLNTFRYKLFCVALKLAMCAAAKQIYGINFPLIIDDVFDASDFNSRLDICQFIQDMVDKHDVIVNRKEYPLQLIFFTQDELIAQRVETGLRLAKGWDNVKFSRIYEYKEMEKDPLVEYVEAGDSTLKYLHIEEMIE